MSDLAAIALATAIVLTGGLILLAAIVVAARRGRRVRLHLDVNGDEHDAQGDD